MIVDLLLVGVLATAILLAMPRAGDASLGIKLTVGVGQAMLALAVAVALYVTVVVVGTKIQPPAAGIPVMRGVPI